MCKTTGFICIHNACRSQMAEAWARTLCNDTLRAYSAGTDISGVIHPLAVSVMLEAGVDMTGQKPKYTDEIPAGLDIVVYMGCGASCPHISGNHVEDWGIQDPAGGDIGEYRKTRDIIKKLVLQLADRVKRGELDH